MALAALPMPGRAGRAEITPVRALPDRLIDRLIDISVCTRPFRARGPRIEAEQRHGKTIVHHYGHGGSGWSLSWGSAHQTFHGDDGEPDYPDLNARLADIRPRQADDGAAPRRPAGAGPRRT